MTYHACSSVRCALSGHQLPHAATCRLRQLLRQALPLRQAFLELTRLLARSSMKRWLCSSCIEVGTAMGRASLCTLPSFFFLCHACSNSTAKFTIGKSKATKSQPQGVRLVSATCRRGHTLQVAELQLQVQCFSSPVYSGNAAQIVSRAHGCFGHRIIVHGSLCVFVLHAQWMSGAGS